MLWLDEDLLLRGSCVYMALDMVKAGDCPCFHGVDGSVLGLGHATQARGGMIHEFR